MKKISILALIAVTGSAFGFGFDDIQNWTGTGPNSSALVVDWNDGKTTESLAWGFHWTGSATGLDMIEAITAADPHLQAQIQVFSFGAALYGFSYDSNLDGLFTGPNDHKAAGFGGPGEDGYWGYYVGGPSATFPSWSFASTGAGGRDLANQSWDGWSWTPSTGTDTDPSVPAAAPVPEPATMAALGLGLLAIRRRVRRQG